MQLGLNHLPSSEIFLHLCMCAWAHAHTQREVDAQNYSYHCCWHLFIYIYPVLHFVRAYYFLGRSEGTQWFWWFVWRRRLWWWRWGKQITTRYICSWWGKLFHHVHCDLCWTQLIQVGRDESRCFYVENGVGGFLMKCTFKNLCMFQSSFDIYEVWYTK